MHRDRNILPLERLNSLPMCVVQRTSAQSITASTVTPVEYTNDIFDPWDMHSTSSNTSRVNIVIPGWYEVILSCEWASNSVGYRSPGVRDTGSFVFARNRVPSILQSESSIAAIPWQFSVGDYVEAIVFHTSTTDPLDLNISRMSVRMVYPST